MREAVGWFYKSCTVEKRLSGKLAIVTGANIGIGWSTTGELARRGATVIMACRNLDKANKAKQTLLEKYGASNPDGLAADIACKEMTTMLTPIEDSQLIIEHLDLSSLDNIRQFAQRLNGHYSAVDYLINNAGSIIGNFEKTVDGFEMTMGANHLGPFLLTQLLLPLLKHSTSPARIINVSSAAHRGNHIMKPSLMMDPSNYSSWNAYGQSKLANILHACELSRRLRGTNIIAVSLHPGVVKTMFAQNLGVFSIKSVLNLGNLFIRTPWQGAQTTLYTVLSDNITSGGYYDNCSLATPSPAASDVKMSEWLWVKSCELVGLGGST